jgi:hypothetical protein
MEEVFRSYAMVRQPQSATPPSATAQDSQDRWAAPSCRIWIYDEQNRYPAPWSCSGFVLYAVVMENDQAVAAMKVPR